MNHFEFDDATLGELTLACQARMDQLRNAGPVPGHVFGTARAAASIATLKAAQAVLLERLVHRSQESLHGLRVVVDDALPPGTAQVRSGDQVVALTALTAKK